MKIRFNRLISILCAVMLLIGAFSAWAAAEETPATTTDLKPAEGETVPEEPSEEQPTEPEEKPAEEPEKEPEQESEGEPEGEPEDDTVDSVEVLITKTLTMGQSWEGKMKKTKPVVLKLDLNRPCSVYMLVEGRDVWATVEKSDRQTENPSRTKADPETGRMLVKWEAEEGSWLITLGPVEPNLLAEAKVTFMDKKAYDAWEEAQAAIESEPEEETEQGEETEPEATEEDAEGKDEPESETEPKEEQAEGEPEPEAETEPEEELTEGGPEPEEEQTEIEAEAEEPEAEEVTVDDGQLESDKELKENNEDLADEEEITEEPEPIAEDEHFEEESGEFEAEEEPTDGTEQDEELQNENEPESEIPERSIKAELYWDVPDPVIGDTAHFRATLIGYENLNYTVQWQYSLDRETWYDVPNGGGLEMDVVVTEENNVFFWRFIVYLEEEPETEDEQETEEEPETEDEQRTEEEPATEGTPLTEEDPAEDNESALEKDPETGEEPVTEQEPVTGQEPEKEEQTIEDDQES